MTETVIDLDSYDRASKQGQRLLARGPLAQAVRFRSGRIHVELNNGCAFAVPAEQVEGLHGASAADVGKVEITAAGLGLYWPALDVDLYVPAMIRGVLGTRQWMAQLGVKGGQSTSTRKGAAARANGSLGGRPRKRPSPA